MITGTSNLFAGAVNMSLRDSRPQALWVQVPFPPMTLSSPTAVSVLNVLIEEVIFGNILGINRTLDNKFSPHCSPVDDFNQIHEVLFGFEASYKFSVIWRPAVEREVTMVKAFQCVKPVWSAASSSLFLPSCLEALLLWPDHCLFPGRVYRTISRAEIKVQVWGDSVSSSLPTSLPCRGRGL